MRSILTVTTLILASLAPQDAIPKDGDFNRQVMKIVESYPTDGTHAYHWPKSGTWRGCTRDLNYGGELLFEGDAEKRAYCCGLTFEVFFRAWEAWCRDEKVPFKIAGRDAAGVRKLQQQWFGSSDDKSCLRTAIVDGGLGFELAEKDWKKAKPGDFVQLWRNSGSGHSVVFIDWVEKNGRIQGLEYWSVQKSTRGIGRRKEMFGEGKGDLDRTKFWICRVGTKAK
ncbi:MAG: hypothetical protein KDB53_00420 [Planctomycetes bacterium]|nr:hypothetical protein [Planctomycetota bacterium]